MQVQVGPWEYQVKLVRGYVQYQGEPCFGLCDHLKRQILIADVLDRGQRLHVLVHELVHAWWHYCPGNVADEEAVADLVALAMSRLLMQVVDQPDVLAWLASERGDSAAPLDLPPAQAASCDGLPSDGSVPKVQRQVLPGDGDGSAGWVLRIFQNPSKDESSGASAD